MVRNSNSTWVEGVLLRVKCWGSIFGISHLQPVVLSANDCLVFFYFRPKERSMLQLRFSLCLPSILESAVLPSARRIAVSSARSSPRSRKLTSGKLSPFSTPMPTVISLCKTWEWRSELLALSLPSKKSKDLFLSWPITLKVEIMTKTRKVW